MGWPKEKEETQEKGEVLKLEDGQKAVFHVLVNEPTSVRTIYHSALKKAVTLPESWPREEGERWRFGFVIYDYTDGKVRTWWTGAEKAREVKANADENGGMDKVDFALSRKGKGKHDTRYTLTVKPSSFMPGMIEGQMVPDLDALTKPSSEEDIRKLTSTPDPQREQEKAERLAAPATAKQLKWIEELADKKGFSKKQFHEYLADYVPGVQLPSDAFVPPMTVGQASAAIDKLKA